MKNTFLKGSSVNMNIPSVSSKSNSTASTPSSTDQIAQLQKQKVNLQKQLQTVSESTDDEKTKELKICWKHWRLSKR